MKVIVTLREIKDRHRWGQFANLNGLDSYACLRMMDEEEFTLEEDQARALGFLPDPLDVDPKYW